MDKIIILGSIIIAMNLIGCYLAYLYGRKTKEFLWREYIAILLFPLIGVLIFAFLIDFKILILFAISSIIGFVLEYYIGFIYHKTLNKRLWTYNRLHINGYTSWLSIPLWGIVGVTFWFFSKLLGL